MTLRNAFATAVLAASSAALLTAPAARAAATAVEGRWATATIATNLHHVRMTHEFRGDLAVFTLTMMNAMPFQPRALEVVRTGRIRIVGPSAAVPGALEADITVEAVAITPLDPDSAWLANRRDSTMCGIDGWRQGVATEVTGRWCEGNQMAERGDVERIILRRDGAALTLSPYWGEGAVEPARPAAARRAATLAEGHVFRLAAP